MSALRMTFLSAAVIILLGIWLTGFDEVHWFLYVPVVFLTFAGLTGTCPGLIFWNKIGFRNDPLACEVSKQKR